MTRLLFSVAVLQFVAQACYADGIYKCTTDAGVTYQSTRCTVGATKVLVPPSPRTDLLPEDGSTGALPGVAPSGRMLMNSSSAELQTGMSDLLVLNNRQWGKPQRITRNRVARAWHEYWNYELGSNGGKRLHFVNGRLMDIDEMDLPLRTASAGFVPAVMHVRN